MSLTNIDRVIELGRAVPRPKPRPLTRAELTARLELKVIARYPWLYRHLDPDYCPSLFRELIDAL